MPEAKSLQQRQAIDLQEHWNLLSEKLIRLQKQHIGETRTEEQFRLAQLITETEDERGQIEQKLQALEGQCSQDEPESNLPIWNVPYGRNPYFTGREALLEALHRQLTTEHTTTLTQAITGLGGIGKTQTAIEYAYRHREGYRIVWWLRAEEVTTLAADYAQLAIQLNLPEHEATEQTIQIQAVRSWLEQHTGWLLIFDNAEERHAIRPYLPQIGNGHVLITSRNPIWDGLGTMLPVEVMQPEEALAFLAKRTNDPDAQAAKILAKTLGYLPLALEQATTYIRETSSSLDHYQALFQKYCAQLLQDGHLSTEYPDTVATTWELSFQKVQKTSLAAADLLNLCAFLASDAIFLDMIIEGETYVPKRLAKTITDPLTLDQLINTLLHYALVQREGNTLTIHRLVQHVLRDQLNSTTQRRWAKRAVQIVNQTFPAPEFSNWSRCERLLSHAQICVRWIKKWDFVFEEARRLLNDIGSYLYKRAAYTEAELLYQHALHVYEKVLGPEHSDVAESLNNLAVVYSDQGQYRQAEPLLQRALRIREKVLGAEHPDTAESLNNLAALYCDQGRYEQVEPLYQHALRILEKALGPEHPDVASSLNNLAGLYYAQDQYEQAEPLLQRALSISEKALGPEHPNVASSLNSLAGLYYAQDQYEQAEPLLQRALSILEKALGPEHPEVGRSLNSLALLYYGQDQYEQAEPLYQRALRIVEKARGPEHPDVATSLNNLAGLYETQGQYAQAEPLYQRALNIYEKALGPEHPTAATIRENLAMLYKTQGQVTKAKPLHQRVRTILTRIFGRA